METDGKGNNDAKGRNAWTMLLHYSVDISLLNKHSKKRKHRSTPSHPFSTYLLCFKRCHCSCSVGEMLYLLSWLQMLLLNYKTGTMWVVLLYNLTICLEGIGYVLGGELMLFWNFSSLSDPDLCLHPLRRLCFPKFSSPTALWIFKGSYHMKAARVKLNYFSY